MRSRNGEKKVRAWEKFIYGDAGYQTDCSMCGGRISTGGNKRYCITCIATNPGRFERPEESRPVLEKRTLQHGPERPCDDCGNPTTLLPGEKKLSMYAIVTDYEYHKVHYFNTCSTCGIILDPDDLAKGKEVIERHNARHATEQEMTKKEEE